MIERLRSGLQPFLTILAALALAAQAGASELRHGHALIGDPKYPPDFPHFDYVNPDAPKGGTVRLSAIGSFDNLNIIPSKGNLAGPVGFIYETLMTPSFDEIASEYTQVAEWVSYPEDFSSVTFKLRDEARWHDGQPITVDDVIFSLEAMKEHNAFRKAYYKNVVRAEETGPRQVTFTFDEKNNRELPHIVGQLPVLPKHFYNEERDPGSTWLQAPLGSGPYRVKAFEAGRYIELERVEDYWAKDLPVNVGKNNIGTIRYEYFLDQTVAFEAFKANKSDYYFENSAKNWATAYDFSAVRDGRVVKRGDIILEGSQPMQAFVMNTRRSKFSDPRVRRAFNLMFNFEWMNKNLFYGQYTRVASYFEGTELKAEGLPEGLELEILESLRGQIPPEVFTEEYSNPFNPDNELVDRRNLREALRLVNEAGWEVRDRVLTNRETGDKLSVEILLVSPLFERIAAPYKQALERLGVQVSIRVVDAAQYTARVDEFDFDMIVGGFSQSESPGNEQRDFWGSEAADQPGSRNTIGIKDPAIDTLIDRIIFAKDREELIAACRALDRVLLWRHYVVPQYFAPNERIAYWNKYSHPDPLPSRAIGFPTIWWHDAQKAANASTN